MASWFARKKTVPPLVRPLLQEHAATPGWTTIELKETPFGRQLLASPPAEQAEWLRQALDALLGLSGQDPGGRKWRFESELGNLRNQLLVLTSAIAALLRRTLPLQARDITRLVYFATHTVHPYHCPYTFIVKSVERFAKSEDLPQDLVAELDALAEVFEGADHKLHRRILALLSHRPPLPMSRGDAWVNGCIDFVESMQKEDALPWEQLLLHCVEANGSKPSKRWANQAGACVEAIGREAFAEGFKSWLPLVDQPRVAEGRSPEYALMLDDAGTDVLKGLVWCTADQEDGELVQHLQATAISTYRSVPGFGPRSAKVGNACIWVLGQMTRESALGALAVLQLRIKSGSAQKAIRKALDAVAQRLGVPPEEVEEMSVPSYGLDAVGLRREAFGDFEAQLRVVDTRRTELLWQKPDGKLQKSVPKAVKEQAADQLKALKRSAKELQSMLPAQCHRIEGLWLARKRWPVDEWTSRYLDHPLVGTLARRLIWWIGANDDRVAACWHEGALRGLDGQAVPLPKDGEAVALWHPIDDTTEAVQAWRRRLQTLEIQQPFKQVHREVYLLTDAEEHTEVYSNRFASHIIKQHQFHALCRARGWRNQLHLLVDDMAAPPHRVMPAWDLRAEFWIEGVGDTYGADTNEAGVFLYLATDQVRFYSAEAAGNSAHVQGGGYLSEGSDRPENHPVPLRDIPPLVLSEILRDVDLFVGVASVGNDPNWSDGGRDGRYRDYWRQASFGDLSATAQTRRTVLEGLIPRLAIADRCELTERFLVVRGELRTYRIHLGSSNILMEPTDQYLCIVPSGKRAGHDTLFLPFEGDQRLSVILSKALLLAADHKIKDRTILSQIRT